MSNVEKLIESISRLAVREVESDELEQPVASSYEELVRKIVEELSSSSSLSETKLRLVRSSLAVLIQRRIGKILEKISSGEDIPGRLLYREERKLVELFSILKMETLSGERAETETKTVETEHVAETEERPSMKLPSEINIVQFLEDFPALQSVSGHTLGPFSRFDIAALPVDDAEELKRKNVVDIVA